MDGIFRGETLSFKSCEGIHEAIVKCVIENGRTILPETVHGEETKGKEDKLTTKELCGFRFMVDSVHDAPLVLDSPLSKTNKKWAWQEFHDRIENHPNPGRALENDEKWKRFLEDDGKYAYTYGERWHSGSQLFLLIQELKMNPNTRQGMLMTWDQHIDMHRLGERRIPCTISSQFMIRETRLHQIYFIRSNDVISIMPSDIFQMAMIQDHILKELQDVYPLLQMGSLQYNVGSLHVYKRDAAKIEEVLGLKWD